MYLGCGRVHTRLSWIISNLLTTLLLYCLVTLLGVSSVPDVEKVMEPPKDIGIPQTGEYDREELQKLTEFRQRHRKTVEGMLCAAAFVRNGNKFTDCTATEAPDGSVGREWCYVEVQLVGVGFRDWDFCAGVVDYDVLRSRAKTLSQLRAFELSHSVLQLTDKERGLKRTLGYFDDVCGNTASSETEMHEFSRALHGLERAMKQVEANWRTVHAISHEYEALEEKIVVARKAALADNRNCSIVQGYSSAAIGDGIRASYFDNPYLRGPPMGFFDHPSLSLTFDEVLPVSGVDIRSFSVRLESYLKVPVTDTYIFYMDADCNFRVFLDGELIIDHGLESRGKFASTFSPVGVVALDGRTTSHTHLKSPPLKLDGGRRFPIVVEYSHQSALKYIDENVARLTLSWSTTTMTQTIVAPEYFFRSRESGETLIVSDLEARLYDLAMLENGAQAFIHATKLVISDVPDCFRGSKMIRTVVKPNEENISFYISHDAIVYVAQSAHSSFIPKSAEGELVFEKSTDVVSVYASGDGCEAHDQQEFIVYYRRFKAGMVKIHLPKATSFFIFLQPTLANVVCQDDVQFLPFKNGDSCAASSSLSSEFDCIKGFGNGYWQSGKGRLQGQWITRTFANPVELRYFHFSALDSHAPSKAKFIFPDGLAEEFELHSKLRYELGYHGVIDSIRIELEVYGYAEFGSDSNTIGGTFALFGMKCGAQVVADKEIRFPLCIDFCQSGEACGPHYVDLGHPKNSHGRLTYGWLSSNVIYSLKEVPSCAMMPSISHASSFVAIGKEAGMSKIPTEKNVKPLSPIAQLLVPIQLIKKKVSGGYDSKTHDQKASLSQTNSSAFDSTVRTLFLSQVKEENGQQLDMSGPVIYSSKESVSYMVTNKIGLPLGAGKTWVIDMPVHALYTVEIDLAVACGDLVSLSLLLNGVEVFEGERLKRGQSVKFHGHVSLERVGSLELSSRSEGLFIVRLVMTPAST